MSKITLSKSQLEQFICVSQYNSLTKAAEELFISQQALSKNMSGLEEHLEVKLFRRSEKGMELTKVGEQILPVAESMFSKIKNYEEIIENIIEKNKTSFSVLFENAFMSYVIPTNLWMKIENFHMTSQIAANYNKCEQDILNDKFDVALVHKNKRISHGLEYISIINEHPCILMHKNHYLAQKNS